MDNELIFWKMIERQAYSPDAPGLARATWEKFSEGGRDRNVYIFGCSEASAATLKLLGNRFCFKGFLDNSKDKQGGFFEGLPVFSPENKVPELSDERDAVIIVMKKSTDVIAAQLKELGFNNFYSIGVLLAGIEPFASFIKQIAEIRKQPLEDVIMFESTNDVDGNSGTLYRYLKSKGSRHRFVWVLKREGSKAMLEGTGDVGICPELNVEDCKKYILYLNSAKWQIWDNLSIPKRRDGQINVFLQHAGLGYKKIDKFFETPDFVDYWLCVNEFVKEMIQPSFRMPDTVKTIFGTYPRNDVLLNGEWHELEKITSEKYDRIIIWAPTFRKSKYFARSDFDIEYPYGIPVVYNRDDMHRLDEFLKENSVLLLIKPHPAQKVEKQGIELDNIVFLDNENMGGVNTYKLLTQVDAMISDYSSIVFDYMLLDRPIAWAVEDMTHFKLSFLMEDPLEYMPGEKLYGMDDLFDFIRHVKNGEDPFRLERKEISGRVNADRSVLGCENVVSVLGL